MSSSQRMFAFAILAMPGAVLAQGDRPPQPVVVTNDVLPVTLENAEPVAVTIEDGPQTIVEYRLVGFTTEVVDGAPIFDVLLQGYPAMHKLCADEFGPNARAATSEDVRRPLHATPPYPFETWIVPTGIVVLFDPTDPDPLEAWRASDSVSQASVNAGDSGPREAAAAADCVQRNSSASVFWGVTHRPAFGRTESARCNTILPVACSAPVSVPVSP